jgi:hypothetical protein
MQFYLTLLAMKQGLHYPETIRITVILPGDYSDPVELPKKKDNSYRIGDILDNINDVSVGYHLKSIVNYL